MDFRARACSGRWRCTPFNFLRPGNWERSPKGKRTRHREHLDFDGPFKNGRINRLHTRIVGLNCDKPRDLVRMGGARWTDWGAGLSTSQPDNSAHELD